MDDHDDDDDDDNDSQFTHKHTDIRYKHSKAHTYHRVTAVDI